MMDTDNMYCDFTKELRRYWLYVLVRSVPASTQNNCIVTIYIVVLEWSNNQYNILSLRWQSQYNMLVLSYKNTNQYHTLYCRDEPIQVCHILYCSDKPIQYIFDRTLQCLYFNTRSVLDAVFTIDSTTVSQMQIDLTMAKNKLATRGDTHPLNGEWHCGVHWWCLIGWIV